MVQIGENWKCPYCGHAQVLHRDRVDDQWHHQNVKGWKHFGIHPIVSISAIVCANSECRELTLNAILGRSNLSRDDAVEGPYKTWTLLPPSSARPQPNYIPKAIRDNYYEACAICELSPEASATVIRRCLQGMIRDFCSISKKRLADEIAASSRSRRAKNSIIWKKMRDRSASHAISRAGLLLTPSPAPALPR